MRYTGDLGCRVRGVPHDMKLLHENENAKYERCCICRMRKRYNKGFKDRVRNIEYLKDHVRNFAQPNGATKRIFNKVYKPENCNIYI